MRYLRSSLAVVLIATLVALAGCGRKGPLDVPPRPEQTQRSAVNG